MTHPRTAAAPKNAPAEPRAAYPPSPPRHWLWGHVPAFVRNRLEFLRAAAHQYGGVVALRLAFRNVWLISDPEIIEAVLVTQARQVRKHFALRINPIVLGKGLLTSEGDFWLRQRRLAQPAFQRPQIMRYVPTFVDHALAMLANWKPGETRDMLPEMMALTMAITSKTLFGAVADDCAHRVRTALQVTQEEFVRRIPRPVQIPMWVPTPGNRRLRQAVRDLDEIVYGFIRNRRASGEQHDDLLSRLLLARDEADQTGMTDQQLRDECLTIFLAGQETTALALTWSWLLLAQHPQAAERVYAEVDRVLNGRTPTADDLPELIEVERALHESMRLYPPAYLVGRETLTDIDLGGYRCPRGTTLLISPWVVHRDPRFFDEPEAFRPERWGNDHEHPLPKYAYFPFGGGPRICIGNTFAMIEMTLILAMIAQRFRFTLGPGQSITASPQFTLRPIPGVMATIARREASGAPDGHA